MRLRRKLLVVSLLVVLVALALPQSASAANGCNKIASSKAAVFDASCRFTYGGGAVRITGFMSVAGLDNGGGCVLNPCRVPAVRLRVYIKNVSFFVPCAAYGQGFVVCEGLERTSLPPVGTSLQCYAFAENYGDKYRLSLVGFRCASGKPNV